MAPHPLSRLSHSLALLDGFHDLATFRSRSLLPSAALFRPLLPSSSALSRLACSCAAAAFFTWVIIHYALGGWELGWFLLSAIGLPVWGALGAIVALVLYRSDIRIDLPLFISGLAPGYWGEWWGTTRGVWTYWNGQTPPDYSPPLWGIGLLTVYHLHLMLQAIRDSVGERWPTKQKSNPTQGDCSQDRLSFPRRSTTEVIRWLQAGSFFALPALTLAFSAPRLVAIDWSTRLDIHFSAGILVGLVLIFYRLDIQEAFGVYVCGMLLGGTYEWLGTWMGEWTYITQEVPPIWIVPLWGLACVAMLKLAR